MSKCNIYQIEYHCPDCGSITPIMIGITTCLGCGAFLQVIQVGPDSFIESADWKAQADQRRQAMALQMAQVPKPATNGNSPPFGKG